MCKIKHKFMCKIEQKTSEEAEPERPEKSKHAERKKSIGSEEEALKARNKVNKLQKCVFPYEYIHDYGRNLIKLESNLRFYF